jgi:hypothetical protein
MDLFFILTGISAAIAALVYQSQRDDVYLVLSVLLLFPFAGWMAIDPNRLIVLNAVIFWINLSLFTHQK